MSHSNDYPLPFNFFSNVKKYFNSSITIFFDPRDPKGRGNLLRFGLITIGGFLISKKFSKVKNLIK